MNRLNDPHGVCASGQYVYVSNDDGHNVSVFTTAGEKRIQISNWHV